MQPANLTQNLILAQCAVKHVEMIMSRGPGPFNRDESVVHRLMAEDKWPMAKEGPEPPPASYFEAARRKMFDSQWVADQKSVPLQRQKALQEKKQDIEKKRDEQKDKLFKVMTHPDPVMHLLMMACEIEKTGLGNCGEQSMVAFKYLVTKSAPGLALMHINGGNHEFVVLGMDVTVPAVTKGSLTFPPDWGHNAVVCDPWYHEWFAVGSLDWQPKMKRILGETLGIAPQDAHLNKAAVKNSAEATVYAKTMTAQWQFTREIWLPHVGPDMVEFASMNRNSVPLQQMRAPTFRGTQL